MTPTLHEWQVDPAAEAKDSLVKNGVAALGWETGTGKTYAILWIAKSLGKPVIVICPKSVVPDWLCIAGFFGVECIAINYEKIRTGKTVYGHWAVKGKVFIFEILTNAILVFDEAHKCSGLQTQNAALLIAATRQHIPMILASATLIANPLKGYALGYALGLHNLTNFWAWAEARGVSDGFFGPEWTPNNQEEIMQQIRVDLGDKFSRIRKVDVPGFPECQIIPCFVQTAEVGDSFEDYLEADRQAVELLKVPGLIERAKELVDEEGFSVAIFVNFRATLALLQVAFPGASLVYGGQSVEERSKAIRDFQENKTHVILLMAQAGGVGISLHDLNGRPRAALICPSHDAVEFLQVLGRIHRAGSLSPAINYVVFASGSPVERRIRRNLEAKLSNLTALNDFDLTDSHALPEPNSSRPSSVADRTPPQSIAPPADERDRSGPEINHGSALPVVPVGPGGGVPVPSAASDAGGLAMSRRAKLLISDAAVVDVQATVVPAPQAERKHARSSPSKLKNLEICPSYEGDDGAGTLHPTTIRGIAMHLALETGNDSELIEGEAELVAMCRDFLADELTWAVDGIVKEVHLFTHDPDVAGFADLLLIGPTETKPIPGGIRAFKRAKIRDYKFGYNLVDLPNVNPQAIAYVTGAFIADPLLEEINFAFLIPRLNTILEHTFNRSELPALKLRISTIAERVRKLAGKEFNVVEDNCLYCGRKATCAALHAKVLVIANAASEVDRLPLPTTFDPESITEPAQLALALNLAYIAEDWATQVKAFALRYRLELGQEVPGYDLIEKRGKRDVCDRNAAYGVARTFGVTELEFLGAASMSIVALEKVVKEHAGDGDKATAAERFSDQLMNANAITRGGSYHVLQRSRKKKALPSGLVVAPAS